MSQGNLNETVVKKKNENRPVMDYTLEDLNKFLTGPFRDAVLEFNGACGKSPYTVENVEKAVDMLLNECRRVIEEGEEGKTAYLEQNRTERLDAVVDIYWTQTQLLNVMAVCKSRFPDFMEELKSRAYDDVLLIEYATQIASLGIQLAQGTIISGHAIEVAAKRIMKNNSMKYTDDPAKAQEWAKHLEDGQELKSYVYNGKTLYCVKRMYDDYIVKPYGFVPVKLGDIV